MKLLSIFIAAIIPFVSLTATEKDTPKLTLSASAAIWKPSDELQLKIGVITLNDTAEQALSENSDKMKSVIAALEAAGLDRDDYETNQFSINPTYTPCPQNPPQNWRASINGYEVTNLIAIHTKKLSMAGKIIDLANQTGANSITDIRFGLHCPRDYWNEALSAAGANALRDAQAIAAATGVRLVRVLSISLNNTQVRSPQINISSFAKDASTPIVPGEVSIEATVTLVYEIN
jgi:uncharacterized protein